MFTDGNVLGGREAIASTNFGTAGNPMFDAKPGCWMYNQGSFITGFFPEEILADLDANVGVMGFPPAEAGGDNPVIGGGDMAMLLERQRQRQDRHGRARRDRHRQRRRAGSSSFISPHTDFDDVPLPERADPELRQGRLRVDERSCSTARTRCRARSVRARSGRT